MAEGLLLPVAMVLRLPTLGAGAGSSRQRLRQAAWHLREPHLLFARFLEEIWVVLLVAKSDVILLVAKSDALMVEKLMEIWGSLIAAFDMPVAPRLRETGGPLGRW